MQDVGQSILESYSRVLESLAFNIMARIDDVLYADDMVKKSRAPPSRTQAAVHATSTVLATPYTTPFISPNTSPIPSPLQHQIPNSPHDSSYAVIRGPDFLADWPGGDPVDAALKKEHDLVSKLPPEDTKRWSYTGSLESSNALRHQLTRD